MDVDAQMRLIEACVTRARGASRGEDDATFWAWEAMWELVREDPEAAWTVIRAVLARCDDDRMLAYVAAGDLEDLLVHHGAAFIDRIEQEAASNPRFLRALVGVWGRSRMAEGVARRLDGLVRDQPPL
jgi:hypothetical protein